MSLRIRLMLLAAICVLPAAFLLVASQLQLRAAREAEVRQAIAAVVRSDADYLAGIIQGANQLLSALELSPAIKERNAPYCSALLSRLTRDNPTYTSISADDADGRSFCTSVPARVGYDGDRQYFRAALEQRRLAVGDYMVSPLSNTPVLPIARPVIAPDGTILGALVLALNLDQIARELEARLPAGTALMVVDRNRATLLRIAPDSNPDGPAALTQFLTAAPSDGPDTADITGTVTRAQIIAHAPAGDSRFGLQVLAARDRDSAFLALSRATHEGIALIGIALALAVIIAGLVARGSVALPIRDLLTTADRLRDGEFSFRTRRTAGRSELARLGRALNELAAALQERQSARAAAEEQLRQFAATLEQRVEERTRELADANARLAAEAAERQRTQTALAQSQKLEALGQLTGGVAHDFNNLLTAVIGSLDLAMERVTDERVRRFMSVAIQAAERGARLTAQMLAFSRKQDLSLKPVDVNDTIAGMSDLLRQTIGPLVQVRQDLADELWLAIGDRVQLEVALVNLAVNARDAMPDGGELLLRTRNASVGEIADTTPTLPPGDYVMLTVSDTGHGMPADVAANAFEPFFTTKGPGKGTGLGLSMVYGFARQAGGTVTIDSCVGRGTAVSIYLPRAGAPAGSPVRTHSPPSRLRHLRILLADDDPDVREATKEMLGALGHTVVAAKDGAAALDSLRASPDIDLLVADFAMPGMTGAELATQAQALIPNLPVLFMTGYVNSDGLRSWSARGYRLLKKPFHFAELETALRGAFGTPHDSAV